MNFEAMSIEYFLLQIHRQRRAGGNGESNIPGNGIRFMPRKPHRRDGGEGKGFFSFSGSPDDFWQRRGRENQRNTMQQQRQNQI